MNDDRQLALFCDFENVAIGVRESGFEIFEIAPVLERLLLKGSIVTKKAYCDWDRYKQFKKGMHEAAFELIEIPHVKLSGKNSADIRMVVDALDLCYTKEHIDTFVIISGDSDFSPLVSKLRENAKMVIGVGVKQSTSDLLISNCDEFIFYDELVSKNKPESAAKKTRKKAKKSRKKTASKKIDDPSQEGIDLVLATTEALYSERGDRSKLWGSMIKQTLKRQKPGFSESAYGFASFSDLLLEAAKRGQLELERDEKSGGYIVRGTSDSS
jgi:uncharacterized LabA/DUF88 family protein